MSANVIPMSPVIFLYFIKYKKTLPTTVLSYKLDSLIKKKKKLKDISKFDSLTWAHVELMVQMFK